MLKIKSSSAVTKHKMIMSTLCSLPRDMLVEVAMQVASKSSAHIEDIRSLRATCKRFHKVTMDKLVGRKIAVSKERKMAWYEKDAYLALLRLCAECDNLEANCILGFEEVYNLRMKASFGASNKSNGWGGRHLTAVYLLGIMLFLDTETQFNECTRLDNPLVDRCRRATIETTSRSWKVWEMKPRLTACSDQSRGRIVKMKDVDFWVEKIDCQEFIAVKLVGG